MTYAFLLYRCNCLYSRYSLRLSQLLLFYLSETFTSALLRASRSSTWDNTLKSLMKGQSKSIVILQFPLQGLSWSKQRAILLPYMSFCHCFYCSLPIKKSFINFKRWLNSTCYTSRSNLQCSAYLDNSVNDKKVVLWSCFILLSVLCSQNAALLQSNQPFLYGLLQ